MRYVAIKGDADLYDFDCAAQVYGDEVIDDLLNGGEHDDREGSPLYVVPDYEITDGDVCGRCLDTLL